MRIIVQDARDLGICISGIKEMCKLHDLDFRAFIRDGVESDDIKHIDDDNLRNVIEHARKREET